MNNLDLQQLTDDRVADAEVLLDADRWSAAYYLAGYAVECALKACIAILTQAGDFPDKRLAEKSWSHEIEKLLDAAGLKDTRDADAAANGDLNTNWQIVKDWMEKSRYEQKHEAQARSLYEAITEPNNGVLQWIKSHW